MNESYKGEVPMDSLPDELLLEVFRFMKTAALKSSTLVCIKWAEIIGQNSVTMRRLLLCLNFGKEDSEKYWENLIKDSDRKYNTVTIISLPAKCSDKLELFRCLGPNLRVLELYYSYFDINEAQSHIEMFSSLQRLEVLKCSGAIFRNFGRILVELRNSVEPVNLPNLKSVTLVNGGIEILKIIKTTQLPSLKIINSNNAIVKNDLLDLLAGQTKLEVLALDALSFDSVDVVDIGKIRSIQFPLKRLALSPCKRENLFGNEKNLMLFMNKFHDTLEELDLGIGFPESVYEMIFKRLHKLKTLSVHMLDVPKEDYFYHNLRPNYAIRNLVLKHHGERKSLLGLLKNLPNIETLSVDSKSMNDEVNIPKIKSITISNIFPNAREQGNWRALVRGLPNVEILSVDETYTLYDETFNIITKGWPRLRHVKLGRKYVATDSRFNTLNLLLNNCKELNTVEISEDAFGPPSIRESMLIKREFKQRHVRLLILEKSDMCNYICCYRFGLGCGRLKSSAPMYIIK